MEVAEKLQLDSNPLDWSVADVVRFLKSTDCAPLARIFLDQVSFSPLLKCCIRHLASYP